ncbi:MAG TPA: hypothetical protein VF771_11660 [Longimicrobiaceae bacterium]
MLIVISDLHLTDCSTAANPHSTAFTLLTTELKASVAAKRATEIHVLLLGDVFDVVRTSYWHQHVPFAERPWNGDRLDPATGMNPDAKVEKQFGEVLAGVLKQRSSAALIDGIKSLGDEANLPVAVTYVLGNHDRVLLNFPSLQRQVAAAFGPVPVTFANHFHSPEYRVFARHGHEWDDNCHGWKLRDKVLKPGPGVGRFDPEAYRVMAIGEVITAELMSGFVHRVRQLRPDDGEFLRVAGEVNNLRPQIEVIHWLQWLMKEETLRERLDDCGRAFRESLEAMLDTRLAREWDRLKPDLLVTGDITDTLGKALAILKTRDGLRKLQKIVPLLEKGGAVLDALRGHPEDSLYRGAVEEYGGKGLPVGVEYLMYGHTHRARQECFGAEVDGPARMYVNTGTFLPLIERAADHTSFFRSNRMTFVCFYRSDEDVEGRMGSGPTVDVWDGMKRKDYLPD